MKAIAFDRFGGTEVLHESDIDVPEPGAGQVRVRVKAAGVNALDGKVRSGAMEAAFLTPLPAVPGYELAGRRAGNTGRPNWGDVPGRRAPARGGRPSSSRYVAGTMLWLWWNTFPGS